MHTVQKMAVAVLAALLLSQPGFAELSSKAKKAEKLAATGKIAEAMAVYQEMIEKDGKKNPEMAKEGRDGMAMCFSLQKQKALDEKNYAEVKSLAEKILTEYNNTPSAADAAKHLVAAQTELNKKLLDAKKYDEYIAQTTAARQLLPEGSGALVAELNKQLSKISEDLQKLAQDSMKAQKFDEALRNLEMAVASSVEKENTARCKYALGMCFGMAKQDDKAAQSYKDIIDNYADTASVAPAYAELYLLYMKMDNKQDALANIKQAVSLAPENSDYLFKQVQLVYALGKKEEAQKTAAKLIPLLQAEIEKTYINREQLQYKLGQAYLITGQYTEASVEFNKALTRNPDMRETRKSLALAQLSDKNYTGAIATYDALIKQFSGDFDEANEKSMKSRDSVELAKKVEDLRRDIAYFHYQKGLSYEQLGDFEKAAAECKLGFEGVSTQEAAATLKRIQAAQDLKQAPPVPAEGQQTPQ